MTGFLLHLYAPMQSWADTGFGQLREAGDFPSRSAVLGLLAAALGIPRADEKLVDLHDALRVHAASIRPGRVLRDFHAVESREGSPRTLTYRDYRHDAHFVSLVEGPEETVCGIVDALKHPTFVTFLGRRSCPPALPLVPHRADGDAMAALRNATLATARAFPMDDPTWRRGRSADQLDVWLDGHFERTSLPDALRDATSISHGSRRARLMGARRAYAATPFTRVRLPVAEASPPSSANEDYFDAAT
jgi:CRISPR system Cascade subunit CasD